MLYNPLNTQEEAPAHGRAGGLAALLESGPSGSSPMASGASLGRLRAMLPLLLRMKRKYALSDEDFTGLLAHVLPLVIERQVADRVTRAVDAHLSPRLKAFRP